MTEEFDVREAINEILNAKVDNVYKRKLVRKIIKKMDEYGMVDKEFKETFGVDVTLDDLRRFLK